MHAVKEPHEICRQESPPNFEIPHLISNHYLLSPKHSFKKGTPEFHGETMWPIERPLTYWMYFKGQYLKGLQPDNCITTNTRRYSNNSHNQYIPYVYIHTHTHTHTHTYIYHRGADWVGRQGSSLKHSPGSVISSIAAAHHTLLND